MLVRQLQLRLDRPALAGDKGLADLERSQQATTLAGNRQIEVGRGGVAVAPGLQHRIGIKATGAGIGGVAAEELRVQIAAADRGPRRRARGR